MKILNKILQIVIKKLTNKIIKNNKVTKFIMKAMKNYKTSNPKNQILMICKDSCHNPLIFKNTKAKVCIIILTPRVINIIHNLNKEKYKM